VLAGRVVYNAEKDLLHLYDVDSKERASITVSKRDANLWSGSW